jgi:hypothetical protein
VALGEGEASPGRPQARWLGCDSRERFPQDLARPGWENVTFAFHDGDEVGSIMVGKVAKKTGLTPEDLR